MNSQERRQAIGTALQALRTTRRLSIEAIAELADLSPVTWRRIEKGEGAYRPTIHKVEAYLGLPLNSISDALNDDSALPPAIKSIRSLTSQEFHEQLDEYNQYRTQPGVEPFEFGRFIDQIKNLDPPRLRRIRDIVNGAIAAADAANQRDKVSEAATEIAELATRIKKLHIARKEEEQWLAANTKKKTRDTGKPTHSEGEVTFRLERLKEIEDALKSATKEHEAVQRKYYIMTNNETLLREPPLGDE